MTTYKLPEWLGGHECHAVNEGPHGALVRFKALGEDRRIIIDRTLLIEVAPPMPEPAEHTAWRLGAAMVFIRADWAKRSDAKNRWYGSNIGVPLTWSEVLALVEELDPNGQLVELVPEPVNLIAAAKAWVERITDDPGAWADDFDYALIAAVEALDTKQVTA